MEAVRWGILSTARINELFLAGVEPSEAESLFQRTVFLAGRIVEPAHDEPRWLLLGETDAGRRLALIFTRRGNQPPADQLPVHATQRKEAL